ncbi:hypothetical protein HHI36_013423 [Cryptolaemus montrouzieri]|uniref:Uncharacterized protein n=1 Tax=Cryptolaemus montrouzieri TaxID=559131 RepID=A0ABD2NHI8_9CUCU
MASSGGNMPERVNVLDSDIATVVTGWYEDLLSDNSDLDPHENVFLPSDHESEISVTQMMRLFRIHVHVNMYMYIPSKPEKCGIKIMALTGAKTHCLHNAYIYARY